MGYAGTEEKSVGLKSSVCNWYYLASLFFFFFFFLFTLSAETVHFAIHSHLMP